jgi:hypothetical protein
MNPPNKTQLLHQIANISAMERGKLSAYTFKDRSSQSGPYHKLQQWQDGKNQTRYVSAAELPAVRSAIEGYAQYQQLTRQYADLVIEETRRSIAGAKKKQFPRRSSSSRRRKSSN